MKSHYEGLRGRADIHVHTRYSGFVNYSFLRFPDSVTDPVKAAGVAKRKKLDVLCITDHNTIRGALIAKKCAGDIDVVIGEEVSSADGEILALFIGEEVKAGLGADETIDRIHEQGGIAIAPHPFSPQCPALETKIYRLNLDGVEAFNAYHRDAYSNLMAQKLSPGQSARLGGSDAHTLGMIGNGYTIFEGNSGEEFRKSILQGNVSFGGSKTPLSECMLWSRESSREILRMIYSSLRGEKNMDVLYSQIDKLTKKNKALGLIGAGVYAGLPLSIFSGIVGEVLMNIKGKRKWNEMQSLLG